MAVPKDPPNATRVRLTCRTEAEPRLVKEAAKKEAVAGVRVLRHRPFPIKVDNANRTTVLDGSGGLSSAAESWSMNIAVGFSSLPSEVKYQWDRGNGAVEALSAVVAGKGSVSAIISAAFRLEISRSLTGTLPPTQAQSNSCASIHETRGFDRGSMTSQ